MGEWKVEGTVEKWEGEEIQEEEVGVLEGTKGEGAGEALEVERKARWESIG